MSHERDRPVAFAALALAGTIWGGSFVLGKIALIELSVPHMILYRFVLASIAFAALLVRARPRLTREDLLPVVVAAVIGVPIQFLLQFEGLARTTASHAALMVGTAPVLVAVAAFVVLHERLRPIAWLALVASTVGVAMIVMQAGTAPAGATHATLTGDLLVLVSMFAAVVWILVSKRLMQRHSAVAVSGVITITGTVALALWVIPRYGLPPTNLRPATWAALVTLGVVATTVTTALWNWGFSHTDAGRAGAFINLEPVVGAILGVWLLKESLGSVAILGGALIVAGACIVCLTPGAPTVPVMRAVDDDRT